MPKTKELVLYTPHEKQLEFHKSPKRFRLCSLGRQAGKSTMCLNELAAKAWERAATKYWFLSPTFAGAKGQYLRLLWALPREVIKRSSDSELSITLINDSIIEFKSGEVMERLRGATLDGVVIDEVREQPTGLWSMVIRPMLLTTGGWAAFVSTPNGYDQFYDLYDFAKQHPEDWDVFQAPSTCNPLITEQEVGFAKTSMSEAQFAQEILAEFRDLQTGKAYVNFGPHNLSVENPVAPPHTELNPYLPIHVGLDFNLTPMAWCLAQKKHTHMHFFDEVFLENSHTQEAAKVLIDKVKDHKPGLVLCGDASSRAGQRAAAGKSDYDILCQMLDQAKIKWINLTPESNPSIKDRVNTVNARLKSASGEVCVTLNPEKCPRLKKDFERVVWKQGSGGMILDQTTDRLLTHMSDGAGYLITHTLPIDDVARPVGALSVVVRSF